MAVEKYHAFISYSHTDCGNIAPAIQKAIENIGKPWYKFARNLTVFRDETNLAASPQLWDSIQDALEHSEYFILLASPQTAKSYWINKEVAYWITKHHTANNGLQKILIILTQGAITWDFTKNDFDWEKTISLPKSLQNKFTEEPLWIDLRDYIHTQQKSVDYKAAGFTNGLTKIIGAIVGKAPREIESAELSRNRGIKTALVLGSLLFLSILFGSLFFYKQSKLNKKIAAVNQQNAIANKLIGDANQFRETNINKALLLYGYAYAINKDSATFDFLQRYYLKNTTYELSTFLDTLNEFCTKKILKNYPEETTIQEVLKDQNIVVVSNREDSIIRKKAYFSCSPKKNIKNLELLNTRQKIEYYTYNDKYNFILHDWHLYIFLGILHEGDADYYLDYYDKEPLLKIRLLYNDAQDSSSVVMGKAYNWNHLFKGICYDSKKSTLYILTKNEPWINENETIAFYELYTFQLYKTSTLTKDPTKIVQQIVQEIGIADLRKEEKQKYQIEN
jgi:hypothetical protein